MAEELTPHHESADFEREDLGAKPIFGFLISLAVICILVAVVLKGVFWLLNREDKAHQVVPSPLVSATASPDARRDAAKPKVKEEIENKFPMPRLEDDERGELSSVRLREDEQLATYGWVDQKSGTVHIPIERAMQLIAQQGLPVHPKTGTVPASPVNTARAAAVSSDTSQKKQKK